MTKFIIYPFSPALFELFKKNNIFFKKKETFFEHLRITYLNGTLNDRRYALREGKSVAKMKLNKRIRSVSSE